MDLDLPLITRADIAKHKEISGTVKDSKLNPYILSAQRTDVEPLLGSGFFFKIQQNQTEYDDLINGCIYNYQGIDYRNYGLKMLISIYAYARYIYFGSNTDTPFGQVQKLNKDISTPTAETSKKSQYIENQKEAFPIWQNIEEYLIRMNIQGYGKNNCCTPKKSPSNGGFKISTITKYR